jgi:TetR/AcrR family tetracycline transcriptional repressor
VTKKQKVQRAKAGLTLDHVVSAAFVVLNRDGLAKLSTRAIAAELGVSMNTVMWHIGTKDRLLDVMADTIVGQVDLAKLHGSEREQASELIERLRRAMLSHRDGASVVAGTSPVMSSTLAFGDHLLSVLFEVCPTYRSAAWTAWNLLYFTLGLVQQEQRASTAMRPQLDNAVDDHRFPALNAVLDDFTSLNYGARFNFGVEQILRSAATMQAP